jgi:hypothetical protein
VPLFVPITGGSPSGDVAVVALAQSDALICTGTVIAPHAVLTAAHCVQDVRLPDIAIGDTLATAVRHAAVAAFVHPDFNAETLDHDIAVLVVDPPLDVPPIAIATTLELAAGSAIRIVGYGYTVAGDTTPPARRTGTSIVDSVDALKVVSHAAPEQTCEGDSGGPALFDGGGGEWIVGVASSGDSACTMFARHTRVDIHAEFVLDTVARSAAGAGGPGDRCWYDANCEAGRCLPAPDEPRWSFCAPSCATSKCPADLQCKTIDGEPRCVHRAPSPGAEGARCTSDADCAGALCLAVDGSSQHVCTTRCFSDLPGFPCPGDETCRVAADGREACFAPAEDDGCTTTRGSGWVLALVSLVFAARVLRRRHA